MKKRDDGLHPMVELVDEALANRGDVELTFSPVELVFVAQFFKMMNSSPPGNAPFFPEPSSDDAAKRIYEAGRQMCRDQKVADMKISVNESAKIIGDREIPDQVVRVPAVGVATLGGLLMNLPEFNDYPDLSSGIKKIIESAKRVAEEALEEVSRPLAQA
jgi:hypothetical protein